MVDLQFKSAFDKRRLRSRLGNTTRYAGASIFSISKSGRSILRLCLSSVMTFEVWSSATCEDGLKVFGETGDPKKRI